MSAEEGSDAQSAGSSPTTPKTNGDEAPPAPTLRQFPWHKHIAAVQAAIEKQEDAVAEGVLNVLLDLSGTIETDLSMRVRLMSRLGCLEQRRGRPQEAMEHLNQGLKLAQESGLSDDPCVAYCLDGLADCYQQLENFDQAEKFRRQAVVIAEARLGGEHPDTGFMKEKMNALRQEREIALLGKDDNCKTLFDILAEQQESGTLTADPAGDSDGSGENVAVFLWEKYISNGRKDMAQNHWREAEGALRAAVERSAQFRSSDPRRCETLRLLSDVLVQMGKDDEARACLEQALTLSFLHIGANSAESARSMVMLGDYCHRKDDVGMAKNYYQQAKNAFILALGDANEESQAAKEKLALLISKVKEERKWSGWSA